MMRERSSTGQLFDQLYERGNVVVHETMDDARLMITEDAIAHARAGAIVAIAVATNEEVTSLNTLVQQAHADAGHTKRARVDVAGSDMLTVRIGDQLMTRQNDRELGVANRDVWTVQRVHQDLSVTITDGNRDARLPPEYVKIRAGSDDARVRCRW